MGGSGETVPTNAARMAAGHPYHPADPELRADRLRAAALLEAFNSSPAAETSIRHQILTELLGHLGSDTEIRSPLFCDYGYNLRIGSRCFSNLGLLCLDVAPITIGDDVQIGPNVQLLAATHPLDPQLRKQKWESGEPITIGDNTWLGGGVIVCPGVTIGANAVIGAGSVVTRDIPPGVLAVGSPARVLRHLG